MLDKFFEKTESVRYVAIYQNGTLTSKVREGVANASSSDSDVYEELLVNPTILTLVGQRGRIDCGGLEYILIRYGNFYQLVIPTESGHASICLDSACDVDETIPPLIELVAQHI